MNSACISKTLPTAALGWATGLIALSATTPLPPTAVTGKEYSDGDMVILENSHPAWLWDGAGGLRGASIWDGLPPGAPPPLLQLDAMANGHDSYFHEVAHHNTASLLFSVACDSTATSIWYENPDGSRGVWASKAQIYSEGVADLNALEVWGPDDVSNTEYVSVWGDLSGSWAILTTARDGVLTTEELAGTIGLFAGAGMVNGAPLDDAAILDLASQVQLDALMYFEDEVVIPDGPPLPCLPSCFDKILFSIEPLTLLDGSVLFDGGEIWTYTLGSGEPAQFLNHGGHVWDTAFDVRGTFGVFSENVDALEALPVPAPVPEAGALAASGLLTGLAALQVSRRRAADPTKDATENL